MNKKRLVDLAEEVLGTIDSHIDEKLIDTLEIELLDRLQERFAKAKVYKKSKKLHQYRPNLKEYLSVKPIIDEAINSCIKRVSK
tara:strand:+ start:44 stop:295 length:252 start_codon:yes stop_codon:yes gene_type:complete